MYDCYICYNSKAEQRVTRYINFHNKLEMISVGRGEGYSSPIAPIAPIAQGGIKHHSWACNNCGHALESK